MEVLILSKTKYGSTQVCVGGICISNKQFIRLLNQGGYYQPADTHFNIGDIWEISFTPVTVRKEPHNEDVIIQTYNFVRKIYQLETYSQVLISLFTVYCSLSRRIGRYEIAIGIVDF